MYSTPPYLNDRLMPIYKYGLVFALVLTCSSIIVGIVFGFYTYATLELTFAASMYIGFILFLKGVALSASICFICFLAFWKKYQINLNNCIETESKNCYNLKIFDLLNPNY